MQDVFDTTKATMQAIRSAAALAAAGQPLPTAFHELLIEFLVATINALAVAESSTPRSILEDWLEQTPTDAEWEADTLASMKALGEQILGSENPELN